MAFPLNARPKPREVAIMEAALGGLWFGSPRRGEAARKLADLVVMLRDHNRLPYELARPIVESALDESADELPDAERDAFAACKLAILTAVKAIVERSLTCPAIELN